MSKQNSTELLQNLINDLLSNQDKDQYRAVIQKASKLGQNPQVCQASINDIKGIANYRLELYKEAVACYRKAIELNNSPNYKNNLALALYQLGEVIEAKQLLQEAARVMKNPIYYMNIAKVWQKMGDSDEATKYINFSEQFKSFQTDFDDAQNGLIFNFLWPSQQQPGFAYSLIQAINKRIKETRSKIKKNLRQENAIKLKDQVLSLCQEIQGKMYDLQKWAKQKGFIICKKTQILKHMLDVFTKSLKKVNSELALGEFTNSQKQNCVEQFLDGFRQTIQDYITLRENPSQKDQNTLINNFNQRRERSLKLINMYRLNKTPKDNDFQTQKVNSPKDESNGLNPNKKVKINQKQVIPIQSSEDQGPSNHPDEQNLKDNNRREPIIQVDKQQITVLNRRDDFQIQVKDIKDKQQCAWQLQINADQFQAFVSKPSNKQQFKNTVIVYYNQALRRKMQSFSNQTNSSVKKFYDTLIWVIKLIVLVKGGKAQINFKQNGKPKLLKVESLIQKMGYIMNEISEYKNQANLCVAVFKTIVQIFSIFTQKFTDKIENIQNNITKLNQNFSAIKQNVLYEAVYKKLSETGIQKCMAREHQLFRKQIFKDKQFSEEEQSVVQNIVVLLIYSQHAKQIKDIDLIGILLEQCFLRQGQAEKELIIRKVAQKIRQPKINPFSKILSLFKLFSSKKPIVC